MEQWVSYQKPIQVALAFHDARGDYARHVGVTMLSLLANTSMPVCVHILHDETLSRENSAKLQAIADEFGQSVRFYPIQLPAAYEQMNCGNVTKGTLYRLMLAELLDVGKVLYLDCDIVVELDVAELWNIDSGDFMVAAVLDEGISSWPPSLRRVIRNTGLSLSVYFNSGMMLLNLDQIRPAHDLLAGILKWTSDYPNTGFTDQNYLNQVFQLRYFQLDQKYNRLVSCISPTEDFDTRLPSIWHFAGGKPWNRFEHTWDILYWHYLLRSPWRGEAGQGMDFMFRERERLLHTRSWRLMAPYRAAGDWVRKMLE